MKLNTNQISREEEELELLTVYCLPLSVCLTVRPMFASVSSHCLADLLTAAWHAQKTDNRPSPLRRDPCFGRRSLCLPHATMLQLRNAREAEEQTT